MYVQVLLTILSVIIKMLVPQTLNSFACDAIVEFVDSQLCLELCTQQPLSSQHCYYPSAETLVKRVWQPSFPQPLWALGNPFLSDDKATCSPTATCALTLFCRAGSGAPDLKRPRQLVSQLVINLLQDLQPWESISDHC